MTADLQRRGSLGGGGSRASYLAQVLSSNSSRRICECRARLLSSSFFFSSSRALVVPSEIDSGVAP